MESMENFKSREMSLDAIKITLEITREDLAIGFDMDDVRKIIGGASAAFAAVGTGSGALSLESAALDAAERLRARGLTGGANGMIAAFKAGADAELASVQSAAEKLSTLCEEDADFIFGHSVGDALKGEAVVSVIATVR
jgi:cell division GTPase FtsZ